MADDSSADYYVAYDYTFNAELTNHEPFSRGFTVPEADSEEDELDLVKSGQGSQLHPLVLDDSDDSDDPNDGDTEYPGADVNVFVEGENINVFVEDDDDDEGNGQEAPDAKGEPDQDVNDKPAEEPKGIVIEED